MMTSHAEARRTLGAAQGRARAWPNGEQTALGIEPNAA